MAALCSPLRFRPEFGREQSAKAPLWRTTVYVEGCYYPASEEAILIPSWEAYSHRIPPANLKCVSDTMFRGFPILIPSFADANLQPLEIIRVSLISSACELWKGGVSTLPSAA
jgi:hypothetical protein